MAQQEQKIEIRAILKHVRKQSNGKYSFRVVQADACLTSYRFLLAREKALKIANQDGHWPIGVPLQLRGKMIGGPDTAVHVRGLKFVKILSVDGHDVQSWAEKHQSPTVAPDVLEKASETIEAAEAEEEAMRHRAPPEPPPVFQNPLEAYEKAMQRLRRQIRLKDPKLSKSDIWTIRDALNLLKEAAGV